VVVRWCSWSGFGVTARSVARGWACVVLAWLIRLDDLVSYGFQCLWGNLCYDGSVRDRYRYGDLGFGTLKIDSLAPLQRSTTALGNKDSVVGAYAVTGLK